MLNVQLLKQRDDPSQYGNELLAQICPTSTGSVVEFFSSDRLVDDELKEDWDQARFFLDRIFCRIHHKGIFQ